MKKLKIATLLEDLKEIDKPDARQQKIKEFQSSLAKRTTQLKKAKDLLTTYREQRFDNEAELDDESSKSLDKQITKIESTITSLQKYIEDMKTEVKEAVDFYKEKEPVKEEEKSTEEFSIEEESDGSQERQVLIKLATQCNTFVQKNIASTISDDREIKNAYLKLNKQLTLVTKDIKTLIAKSRYRKQPAITTVLIAPTFIYTTLINALAKGLQDKPGVMQSAMGKIVQKIKDLASGGEKEDLQISKKRADYLRTVQRSLIQSGLKQSQAITKELGKLLIQFPDDPKLVKQYKTAFSKVNIQSWNSIDKSIQAKDPMAAAGFHVYLVLLMGVNKSLKEI